MLRKSLACLVAVSLFTATGCQTGGIKDSWSRMTTSFGGREKVSPEFREAQKMLKHPEQTLVAMARWKEDNEEYGEAKEQYRQILVAYPENIDAKLGLARIEMAIGRQQQAEEQLLTLSKELPDNIAVARELARLYSSREEWPRAISVLNAIADRHPEDQPVQYELGVAYARAGQIDTALPHLTFAVGEAAAKYNVGYLLHEAGNDAEAISWFEQSLKAHPDERTSQQCRRMLTQLTVSDEMPVAAAPTLAPVTIGTPTIQPQVTPGRFVNGPAEARDEVAAATDGRVIVEQASQASPPEARKVMQPVSWTTQQPSTSGNGASTTAANGRSSYSMNDMPQWSGPAAKPAATAAAVSSSEGTAPKTPVEPPVWRARK